MIRDILKFQQVFVDGRGYAGLASAIEVPKVEQVMRDYSAGGMGGGIEVPMGRLEKLTATITFQGFAPELYTHFGIAEGAVLPFTVRGSAEDGNGTTHSHVVKMRGLIKKDRRRRVEGWRRGSPEAGPVPALLQAAARRRGSDRG